MSKISISDLRTNKGKKKRRSASVRMNEPSPFLSQPTLFNSPFAAQPVRRSSRAVRPQRYAYEGPSVFEIASRLRGRGKDVPNVAGGVGRVTGGLRSAGSFARKKIAEYRTKSKQRKVEESLKKRGLEVVK